MLDKILSRLPFRRERRRQDRLAFLAFLALAVLVVFLSFFLTRLPGRISFTGDGADRPDFSKLLPNGALSSVDSVVTLPAEPQPSYAVGYAIGRGSGVALFVWDKATSRYVHADDVGLASVQEGQLSMAPTLTLANLGEGATPAILARVSASDEAAAVFVLLRSGERLLNMPMRDGLDEVRPAFFIDGDLRASGSSATADSRLEMRDANGDDWIDLVLTSPAARPAVQCP
jgi:hypothetical protein